VFSGFGSGILANNRGACEFILQDDHIIEIRATHEIHSPTEFIKKHVKVSVSENCIIRRTEQVIFPNPTKIAFFRGGLWLYNNRTPICRLRYKFRDISKVMPVDHFISRRSTNDKKALGLWLNRSSLEVSMSAVLNGNSSGLYANAIRKMIEKKCENLTVRIVRDAMKSVPTESFSIDEIMKAADDAFAFFRDEELEFEPSDFATAMEFDEINEFLDNECIFLEETDEDDNSWLISHPMITAAARIFNKAACYSHNFARFVESIEQNLDVMSGSSRPIESFL